MEPIRISHSRLQAFDRCRYRHYMSYVERWKKKGKNKAMMLGSIGHELLAMWYRTHDFSLVRGVFETMVRNPELSDNFEQVANAMYLVDRYIRTYAPEADHDEKVIAVEQHFVIPLKTPKDRPYELQGVLDLLYQKRDNSGLIRTYLRDHKFTSKLRSEREVQMDPQLPMYWAAMRHFGYNMAGFDINMIHTYDYSDWDKVDNKQVFRRIPSYRSDIELDNFLIETGRLVDKLVEEQDDQTRSLRLDCPRCQFSDICLYALKGIDITDVLLEDFEHYEPDTELEVVVHTDE